MRKNKRLTIVTLAVTCFLFLSGSIIKGDSSAPDFKLQDLKQNTITLRDYRNRKAVVLFFWTTWCPFCRKEIKTLNNHYSRFAGDGVELFAVNIGEHPDKVGKFIKGFSLLYQVLLDTGGDVARSYGIQGVPTYIFINKKGEVTYRGYYFPEPQYKALIKE